MGYSVLMLSINWYIRTLINLLLVVFLAFAIFLSFLCCPSEILVCITLSFIIVQSVSRKVCLVKYLFWGRKMIGSGLVALAAAVYNPATDRNGVLFLLANGTGARSGVIGDISRGVARVLEKFEELVAAVEFHYWRRSKRVPLPTFGSGLKPLLIYFSPAFVP